jgi:hypothetical protein
MKPYHDIKNVHFSDEYLVLTIDGEEKRVRIKDILNVPAPACPFSAPPFMRRRLPGAQGHKGPFKECPVPVFSRDSCTEKAGPRYWWGSSEKSIFGVSAV